MLLGPLSELSGWIRYWVINPIPLEDDIPSKSAETNYLQRIPFVLYSNPSLGMSIQFVHAETRHFDCSIGVEEDLSPEADL